MLLASVVHHREWLRKVLHVRHPVFQSVLFAGGHADTLSPFVVCRLAQSYDDMRPTGVPAAVSYMLQLKKVQDECLQLHQTMGTFVTSFGDELRKGLDEFAVIDQGTISGDTMRSTVDGMVHTLQTSLEEKFPSLLAAATQSDESGTERRTSSPEESARSLPPPIGRVYLWGDMMHRLPEDFQLPIGTVRQAFIAYTAGNIELKYPPLMLVDATDMSTRDKKKRFSELKGLMSDVTERAQSEPDPVWPKNPDGTWVQTLTMDQAATVYDAVKHTIAIPERSPKGRRRRREQLRWSTHAREWKTIKKRRQQESTMGENKNESH